MAVFAVEFCELKACQNWRPGDRCIKNGMDIETAIKYIATIHDGDVCAIRKQIDIYRLNELLES